MSKSEIDKLKEELAREIEGRKLAEDKLRQCESDLHSVIDNIQDVFYRSDKDGNLMMASRS
jgi:PAS domain-containing protein